MAEERAKRRLAAIRAAELAGDGRLVQTGETRAVERTGAVE